MASVLIQSPGWGAGLPNGQEIFGHDCARCHGRNGEGVKEKYEDALYGDWSIEKLTRYIDRKMPDDEPEKCVGADAQAVARYIYDTFYSRAARARNFPPRVELVRLTNRQYVNVIADLVKSFGESDKPLGSERGLRGNYQPRGAIRNQQSFERVDRQVNFDFGARHPFGPVTIDSVHKTTNEFSINWRGSVIADENGEYEFVIETPNGARLWVNDEDEPLIDAGVASGDVSEHKATLRLIGGRAYPLRLECFKVPKDKTSSIALLWKPPHGTQQIIPARNLSPVRLTPTFVIKTPFPPDDSSVGYERGVLISKAWDEATTQAAIEVANHFARKFDRPAQTGGERRGRRRGDTGERSQTGDTAGSSDSATNRAAKARAFCEEFVTAAFRRPLTDEQQQLYIASQFKKAAKPEEAVKRVILLALKSPRFLYLGLEHKTPDDFEVASRLSFDLWDSLPDRELLKLAARGELRTRDQVSGQARRMLDDSRAHAKVQYFLQHWLQMNRVEDVSKDPALYPEFTPEIIADLRTSLNLFLEDAVWKGSSDYRQLLLSDSLFVNGRLARFYGVRVPQNQAPDDFTKVALDPRQRCGVVTHPYLLAVFSYQKSTSPIHRGVFLTRNIVGRRLKPPPMAQTFKDADFAPNLTMREKISELTRPQACQGCHSVINPLGFSLEHYDAVGKFRTRDNGRPVDAASEYITDDGATVKLTGARDVAEFAAGSEPAQNGFIEQLFHSVVKQPMLAYGPDVMDRLHQSLVASGFNMQKLLVDIATVTALHGIEPPVSTSKKL